ncbi:MAG: hypothetical protein M1158_03390 [Candidatus Marsarchaeota archaeon]|nr:hypothetical protein [Candidatus Marsarchaeota archaeon]
MDERLRFVKLLADYVRRTPNGKWSKQQNTLINSVLKSASQDISLYLKVKKAGKQIASPVADTPPFYR